MSCNKSSGPSDVSNALLKKCCDTFTLILFKFYTKILGCEKIPYKLKIVSVTPVYKKGKPIDEINSYRPITVENNFLKLFEKLILI